MIKKHSWVLIENVLLTKEERAANIPEDTRNTDLMEWCKGFTQEEANIGDIVEIVTVTGRKIKGTIKEVNPGYNHNFGEFIPDILYIGMQAREILRNNK